MAEVPEAQPAADAAALAATDADEDAAPATSAEPSARAPEVLAADQPEPTENGHQAAEKIEAYSDDARELEHKRESAATPEEQKEAGSSREKRHSERSDRDSERRKDKESSRSRDKERGRDKERSKDDSRDKDGGRDRRHRSKERDRERDTDRSRGKDRDRSDRDKDDRGHRSSSRRDKERDRSRDRSRRHRSRSRSAKRRSRSRDRSHRRSRRSPSRSRSRSRHRSSRRRSRSASVEYGGYVPRKRQEIPRARPEPAPGFQPPKTTAFWLHQGVGRECAGGYSTSYTDPYAALRSSGGATTPQEIARQMQEQQLKARQLVLQQQAASAVAAASKTQREVYVGNLVSGLVTEEALRQLFNSTMQAAFPDKQIAGLDPVVNVSMHSEGRYAFVELRSPDMASAALQLSNQVQLLGQPISVGRPSGYVDPSKAQQAALAAQAALEAFQSGDTNAAAQALNEQGISVPGFSPPPGTVTAAEAADGAVPSPVPTRCLSVTGMVTADVLVDDAEYQEVILDLQEECGKYGMVESVKVPRPALPAQAPALFGTSNFGKGFVKFADEVGAQQAKNAIHGRLFAGETVQVIFVAPEFFEALV
ncbi:hypothetical protein WJX84_002429 [Apatococcus fuscideae]